MTTRVNSEYYFYYLNVLLPNIKSRFDIFLYILACTMQSDVKLV